MAQIVLPRTPQGTQEYDKVQIDKLVANLEQLILLLNSTYTPETLRNDEDLAAQLQLLLQMQQVQCLA